MIISKSNTIKEEEVLSIFNSTNDLSKIDAAVTNAGGRLYTSWASVDVIDKDNEKIPIEDLIKQQQTLLERNGPITDNHTNKVIGQTLGFKVMEHPISKTTGILHLNKIFNNYKLDDQVWEETKSGERTGSSVGGVSDSVRMENKDGRKFGVIEGFEHVETANVYAPANQLSTNQAVSVAKGSLANPNDVAGVAKLGDTSKPPQLDRCVAAVMQEQDLPEERAFAICQASLKNTTKGLDALFSILTEVYGISQEDFDLAVSQAYPEGTNMTEKTSVDVIADNLLKGNFITGDEQKQLSDAINRIKMKAENNKDINKEAEDKVYEDSTEDKKLTKDQDKQKSELDTLKSKVLAMEKLLANKRGEEEEEEEKRDMPEENTEEEVEDKGAHEDEDEEEETTKEEAASDIEGIGQAESPDSPKPDESNDADVFKKLMARIEKLESTQKKAVKKSFTPRAGGSVEKKDVKKSYAERLATGEIKKKWSEVHLAVKKGVY